MENSHGPNSGVLNLGPETYPELSIGLCTYVHMCIYLEGESTVFISFYLFVCLFIYLFIYFWLR